MVTHTTLRRDWKLSCEHQIWEKLLLYAQLRDHKGAAFTVGWHIQSKIYRPAAATDCMRLRDIPRVCYAQHTCLYSICGAAVSASIACEAASSTTSCCWHSLHHPTMLTVMDVFSAGLHVSYKLNI